MDPLVEQTSSIKRRLGSLWNVFFHGFGGRLTPVQLEAVPLLLDRKNVVLCSPTASGKTEAVLAPIARHMLNRGAELPGVRLLYVVPTRALVADMRRRFAELLAEIGLTASFRTSDTPRLPSRFPQILFTTPESLDSLLCRKRDVWRNIEAIVLDELHLLDNTYRGDQLRVLLARLEIDWLTRAPLKAILSATVPEPDALARRFIGPAHVVSSGEPRSIHFRVVGTLAEAISLCKQARRDKVLVFCNTRKDCETLAREATLHSLWPQDSIFVHHASLAYAHRSRVEASIREATLALCFATMTLELGIDIGDVSAAVLHHPPLDVSSFLQRLGRACRREKSIFAIGIAANEGEVDTFRHMVQLAQRSFLEPVPYVPDCSVVVQQTFSILFARPSGLLADHLYHYVECLCPRDTFDSIIDQLVLEGHLNRFSRLLVAGERVMDMGERGELHSNIPDSHSTQVVDASSGQVIGHVAIRSPNQTSVVIGGRSWKIIGRTEGSIVVSPSRGKAEVGTFCRRSQYGKFFSYLPRQVKIDMQVSTLRT